MRDDAKFEEDLNRLLEDPEYSGHPLREALAELLKRYTGQLAHLEKLTSISDGYQSVLQQSNQSLSARYEKQFRQLQKIVRISDHYQRMLQEANERLHVASTQDPLTNLPNRRLMQDRLKSEAAKAHRHKSTFSLALIDVDFFKTINDTWGHEVGDAALVCLSQELAHQLRAYDLCARWGGEEFLVLFPETRGDEAIEIAHRLRTHANALCVTALPEDVNLSISIGVAEHKTQDEWEATLRRADEALYRAKAAGRNCVSLAE
jgi:diguanylate cyclase (GGDEF)-like protein